MTIAMEGPRSDRNSALSLGTEDAQQGDDGHISAEDHGACRRTTLVSRQQAVERVVGVMRSQLDRPFSLQAMARLALLSPYHFSRVFRSITGVPPHCFLTALRMQAAKRLLLTTELRVIDVCFSVGYQSIGTFTTRFKELVGTTPRKFRETSEETMWRILEVLVGDDRGWSTAQVDGHPEVMGKVFDTGSPGGPTFVGLFDARTSSGQPAACAVLTGPDSYRMTPVAEGRYRILAARFDWSAGIRDYLLPDDSRLWVGMSPHAVHVRGGQVSGDTNVTLRRKRTTDPPIVMAFPFSMGRRPPRPLASPLS